MARGFASTSKGPTHCHGPPDHPEQVATLLCASISRHELSSHLCSAWHQALPWSVRRARFLAGLGTSRLFPGSGLRGGGGGQLRPGRAAVGSCKSLSRNRHPGALATCGLARARDQPHLPLPSAKGTPGAGTAPPARGVQVTAGWAHAGALQSSMGCPRVLPPREGL